MIEVIPFNIRYKSEWDSLIERSRIVSFLFFRDFMDYHADRFIDKSLLVFRKGKLEAVLPGNVIDNTFYSHLGLTYGGLISSTKMTSADIISSFKMINDFLSNDGIKRVVYKAVPTIYQNYPSQEDIYALYKLNARKIGCNISSSIFQNGKINFSELRNRGIKKAIKANIIVSSDSNDFNGFWDILSDNLQKSHGAKPVHSLDEIILLKKRFPDNIKLYTACKNNIMLAGCVMFLMQQVAHVQYISANEDGKANGALDLLFNNLINEKLKQYPVFDFGQSTDQNGNYLNENLIFQKEGFGGRGIVYDTYEYKINCNSNTF